MKIDKKKLQDYLPLIAVVAMIISSLFIGMTIGAVSIRNNANIERQILVDNHAVTIAAKDQTIELLAKSTVAAADALTAQTEVTVDKAKSKTAEATKTAALNKQKALQLQKRSRSKAEQDAQKLRELK